MKSHSLKKLISSDEQGFSLVEMLLSMTIVLIILGILSSIIVGMNYQLRTQRVRLESVGNAEASLDAIVRVVRMAGNRPVSCPDTFTLSPVTVSNPLSNGYFSTLRIQSDWNQPDCALNGVDENVTYSVQDKILFTDANRTIPFVDKIAAVRFKLFDETNTVITDPNLAPGAKFVHIEIDTVSDNGSIATMKSGASLRK